MTKVLYVEDNPLDAMLFKKMLRDTKLKVNTAPSCEKAFTHLNNNKTDILCLDLGLKDSQGADTVDIFRKHYPNIPIIVRSAVEDPKVVEKVFQIGIDGYLPKHITNQKLIKHVMHTSTLKGQYGVPQQLSINMIEALYHDVMGSINAIQGFVSMLDLKDHQQEINVINYSVHELQTLMHNVLDYHQNLYGSFTLTSTPIAIQGWLESQLLRTEKIAKEKGIRFLLTQSEEDDIMLLDKERLEHVLFQLMHFLVKYHHNTDFIIRFLCIEHPASRLWIQIQTPNLDIDNSALSSPLFRNGMGLGLITPLLNSMGATMEIENIGDRSCIDLVIPAQRSELH